MATVNYSEQLFKTSDSRLSCFISPMGPFVDPGSRCFEDPERYGYRLFARTLEEHRNLLVRPSWELILNYETRWMSRVELVDVTYDAAKTLNSLKLKYGRISPSHGREVAERIERAKRLNDQLRLSAADQAKGSREESRLLLGEVHAFSVSTVCDKRELFWRNHPLNFKWQRLVRIALTFFCSVLLEKLRLSAKPCNLSMSPPE